MGRGFTFEHLCGDHPRREADPQQQVEHQQLQPQDLRLQLRHLAVRQHFRQTPPRLALGRPGETTGEHHPGRVGAAGTGELPKEEAHGLNQEWGRWGGLRGGMAERNTDPSST